MQSPVLCIVVLVFVCVKAMAQLGFVRLLAVSWTGCLL